MLQHRLPGCCIIFSHRHNLYTQLLGACMITNMRACAPWQLFCGDCSSLSSLAAAYPLPSSVFRRAAARGMHACKRAGLCCTRNPSRGLLQLRIPGCCFPSWELRCIFNALLLGRACLQTCRPALHLQPFRGACCGSGSLAAAFIQGSLGTLERASAKGMHVCRYAGLRCTCSPFVGPAAAQALWLLLSFLGA